MIAPLKSIILRDFSQRLISALGDGYVCQVKTELVNCAVAKLRHRSNGNRMQLIAHYDANQNDFSLVQYTNHLLTFIKRYN